jgi:ribosomal protein S27E
MKAKYLLVRTKSGHEQVVFSHTSSVVYSNDNKDEIIAHPSGGRAIIHGDIVKELG